jgi:hypothetical protein
MRVYVKGKISGAVSRQISMHLIDTLPEQEAERRYIHKRRLDEYRGKPRIYDRIAELLICCCGGEVAET